MGLFEQFPYTNYDRLNLDSLIKYVRALKDQVEEIGDLPDQMKALSDRVGVIEALYQEFASDIKQQFQELQQDNINTFNTLKAGIDAEFALLKADVEDDISTMEAQLSALSARLDHVLNNLPSEVFMISPFTGEEESLEMIINQLANAQRTDSLTASEYDALALTATTYDAKNITAYNYDWNGKNLL